MRPISEATARIAGKSFSRKYIARGRIVKHWEEIVGAALATQAQPARLMYRKFEKSKEQRTVLEIATSSAYATRLHYQKDLILERINMIFGDSWVSDIRFVSIPANTACTPRPRKKAAPLTETQKKYLAKSLCKIGDDAIRERLERLGRHIMLKEKEEVSGLSS